MVRTIELHGKYGNGKVALIDDSDFDLVENYRWTCLKRGYVTTSVTDKGKKIYIYMHRLILGVTDSRQHVDHKNRNPTDNTRNNLRICTHRQNNQNRSPNLKRKTSQYKGVCWWKRDNRWMSQISINGLHRRIGYFDSELEAAMHYDYFSNYFHGEFACNNGLDISIFKPNKGLHLYLLNSTK